MPSCLSSALRVARVAAACVIITTTAEAGQAATPPDDTPAAATQEILEQIRQLRAEVAALRGEVAALRDGAAQDQDLVNAKLQEHEQTKVESGSKYHVRLSGALLLNLASVRGGVDSIDLPLAARAPEHGSSSGATAGSIRQSMLALDVFGPRVGGARTSGNIAMDFFGGFPETTDGLSAPRVRLRTGAMTIDWPQVSVTAGQESPFFSPRSPTSLFASAYPALSSSGNLWAWTPEVFVQVRRPLPHASTLAITGGVLDPFTGELPVSEYERLPTAGERTSVPAVATHVGVTTGAASRPFSLGGGAYYSKQDWDLGRSVRAWAATADWDVPLGPVVAVSGEFYKGRAIGGLGGGLTGSVLFAGDRASPDGTVVPIESIGGWTQVKVTATNRLEFNGAFGSDRPTCSLSQPCTLATTPDPQRLRRNATASVNAIYQLRSNLLFSLEYRRLMTTPAGAARTTADHISLNTSMGF